MWRLRVVVMVTVVTFPLAMEPRAAFADEGFACGGADVRFSFPTLKLSEEEYPDAACEESVEAVVTVSRGGRETVLRFDSADYIGGVCVKDRQGRPTVVFQAVCGGSSCQDLDNWGIIQPTGLRVRLVPTDENRREAARILGRPLPNIDHMIAVEKLGPKCIPRQHSD